MKYQSVNKNTEMVKSDFLATVYKGCATSSIFRFLFFNYSSVSPFNSTYNGPRNGIKNINNKQSKNALAMLMVINGKHYAKLA